MRAFAPALPRPAAALTMSSSGRSAGDRELQARDEVVPHRLAQRRLVAEGVLEGLAGGADLLDRGEQLLRVPPAPMVPMAPAKMPSPVAAMSARAGKRSYMFGFSAASRSTAQPKLWSLRAEGRLRLRRMLKPPATRTCAFRSSYHAGSFSVVLLLLEEILGGREAGAHGGRVGVRAQAQERDLLHPAVVGVRLGDRAEGRDEDVADVPVAVEAALDRGGPRERRVLGGGVHGGGGGRPVVALERPGARRRSARAMARLPVAGASAAIVRLTPAPEAPGPGPVAGAAALPGAAALSGIISIARRMPSPLAMTSMWSTLAGTSCTW